LRRRRARHGPDRCRPAVGHRPTHRGADLALTPAPAAGEIDFLYGPLAGADFPTPLWLKALRAAERQRPPRLEYEDPRGNPELRRALQAHLSRSRGLACTLDQLLIVNGSQQALDLCARLLLDPGDRVVVENPATAWPTRCSRPMARGCSVPRWMNTDW
jgi:GntR family transcriptional regulator/MocR family aminotransferase